MMKRILVPTDGSEPATIAVQYAIALAQKSEATLHGLHVIDVRLLEGPFLRDISASLGTAPYVNYEGNIAMILEERGKLALEAFRELCESAKVPCKTSIVSGMVSRSIVENSELADLVVLGHGGEHSEWLEGLVGSTTEAVVRRAIQPVLITSVSTPGLNHFLVAYDGSRHAKRALKTAAAISTEWHMPFHLLVVSDPKSDTIMAEARAYLDAYDFDVEYVQRQGDPSEVIIAYAHECDASLLVMGAYGHTKVRELVIGSTTTYAMNHAPCPLLLLR